jgi:peptidoglycan/xylan/chitin deacetylase (PgdA/CDA1 family)
MRAVLKEYGIKTMFFVVGQEAEARPGDLRAILSDGNSLGNHSWAHEHLPGLSSKAVRDSLLKTDRVVRRLTGYDMTPNWRAPYGEHNGTVDAAAASLGYTMRWGWDIDSEDSGKLKGKTGAILEHIRSELHRCAGTCQILFHDFPTSVDSLSTILPALKNDGVQFVPFP